MRRAGTLFTLAAGALVVACTDSTGPRADVCGGTKCYITFHRTTDAASPQLRPNRSSASPTTGTVFVFDTLDLDAIVLSDSAAQSIVSDTIWLDSANVASAESTGSCGDSVSAIHQATVSIDDSTGAPVTGVYVQWSSNNGDVVCTTGPAFGAGVCAGQTSPIDVIFPTGTACRDALSLASPVTITAELKRTSVPDSDAAFSPVIRGLILVYVRVR